MQMVQRLALLLFAASVVHLDAQNTDSKGEEQKFSAILVWGTDGEKPEGKKLKDVDPALKEKFKKIFKWENYFEVSRTNATVKPGQSKHLKLSRKCEVKLHQTEKEGLAVELIGEGKTVYNGKSSMPLKDILILAGDDINETAWFVVLKPEEK